MQQKRLTNRNIETIEISIDPIDTIDTIDTNLSKMERICYDMI